MPVDVATANVKVLFGPRVTRVHAPFPLCVANQIGTSLGSQLAKLNETLALPPGAGVTCTLSVVV